MSAPFNTKCSGELEAQIGRAVIHFEKEFMGRGPLETKTYLMDDLILVRLKGVLTPAERKLVQCQNDRSASLLKQVRNELLASGRPQLEAAIRDIVGVGIQSVHTDISTKTGERVIVFTLERRLQFGDRSERDLAANRPTLPEVVETADPAAHDGRRSATARDW